MIYITKSDGGYDNMFFRMYVFAVINIVFFIIINTGSYVVATLYYGTFDVQAADFFFPSVFYIFGFHPKALFSLILGIALIGGSYVLGLSHSHYDNSGKLALFVILSACIFLTLISLGVISSYEPYRTVHAQFLLLRDIWMGIGLFGFFNYIAGITV